MRPAPGRRGGWPGERANRTSGLTPREARNRPPVSGGPTHRLRRTQTRRTIRACLHAPRPLAASPKPVGLVPPARETSTKGSVMRARPRGSRDGAGLTRRALLARGAAPGGGAAAVGAVGARAAFTGHTPPPATPARPPPSSDLVS